MNSELAPVNPSRRPSVVKDVVIAVLALSLCFCLAALIQKTRELQASSGKIEALQNEQKTTAQALATAEAAKTQSAQALRRAQITLKAGAEAQSIALHLRQAGATAQSR